MGCFSWSNPKSAFTPGLILEFSSHKHRRKNWLQIRMDRRWIGGWIDGWWVGGWNWGSTKLLYQTNYWKRPGHKYRSPRKEWRYFDPDDILKLRPLNSITGVFRRRSSQSGWLQGERKFLVPSGVGGYPADHRLLKVEALKTSPST